MGEIHPRPAKLLLPALCMAAFVALTTLPDAVALGGGRSTDPAPRLLVALFSLLLGAGWAVGGGRHGA